ncbi:MAG: AAA family ATPase [Anaerolineae bacterium]|nr:AAA family ATPase [Anaerolineae bacterium]
MRFKHLTLQGYKSFATKTEFLFPTGITAVVGPNGSGKSNIADGIRWVLGEQRISSLRGKSTADMIYAGGRRRARAGMAEVCLTLDNSDDWLPIEFSEVTLTRRAYRSGENEYLLNGSKVRLRDINDLLAAGGLSQSAYTVIGQGLVDTALSLRPQERRDLFEEAAGISAYRSRREDALERLEETQHNLERVYDIVGEINPRLRRLEREVARVEENRRLIAHLERLQRTWYGYQWGCRQDTLAQALEKASYLESDREKHQGDASALSEKLVRQRQRESKLRTLLRDWYRDSADLLDRVNEARRELAVAEERTRLLRTRHEELLAEIEPLLSQEKTQAERVDRERTQNERLEHQLTEHRARLVEQEKEWLAAEAQAQEPSRRRAEVEQELDACRIRLTELIQALAEARTKEARLVGEQEALDRMQAEETAHDAGTALLQTNLDGILGTLAALIQAPPEWECAIEAILGPDLQAIVVKHAAIITEARQILESSGGRVTLLPLDSLRPPPPLPTGVGRAGALRAADVIACDEAVRPAVETLLGSAALCKDLAAARALLPQMPPGGRCATPSGVVLRADGALSMGTSKAAGTLTSERARRELPAKLEQIRQHCQQLEERQQAETKQRAALEAKLDELAQQAALAREEAARVERETLGKLRTEAAVAEEALRSQQVTRRREDALLERLQTQLSARRQRIEELDAEHAAVVAHAERLRTEVAQAGAQLNQAREHIQPTEDELTRLGEEQTALERQEQQAREGEREAEIRYGRAQLEVDRCQDELNLLSRQIEEDLGLVELELADSVTAQTPLPLRPVVSELPIVEELPEGLQEEIQRLKARLRRAGDVNPSAPEDYTEVKERHQFLTEQSADLEAASERLRRVIAELDELMEAAFQKTFDAVAERFTETFTTLFNGGTARLELTEPDDLMNTGVDIVARPPGKRAQRLALLSGGERSLTAVALLFAILQVSPAPFCVLDEVDAALDEANIGRFRSLLTELAQQTQFIIITHNRGTIEVADTLYGVSMGADGVSQVVSLKMD